MHVDETGGHIEAGGIDRPFPPAVDFADRNDAIPVDGHIGDDARRPAPVEDGASPDHQVVVGRAAGEAHRQDQPQPRNAFPPASLSH